MNMIGLDIGTTTICAVVVDTDTGMIRKSATISNDSLIKSGETWEKIQDSERIMGHIDKLVCNFAEKYAPIAAIGITGQMHGIIYTDRDGLACSPLYTWQDGRGDRIAEEGRTYCEVLTAISGYTVASGYGMSTHFFNMRNGLVPENARSLCTIHDYICMRLSGAVRPVIHISDAASLGIYNLRKNEFDTKAIRHAGMNADILPEVTAKPSVAGYYKGIPVVVAIGDNQASFLGSVSDTENGLLINMGTGSQISAVCSYCDGFLKCELRPFTEGSYLVVGSSLCGGRAYAALERFFRRFLVLYGEPDKELYRLMDRISEQAFMIENKLVVETLFSGTRSNPEARGSIYNISLDNFTPEHLIAGVLEGTVNELYDFYQDMAPYLPEGNKRLIGSGNGLRKSRVWRQLFADKFGMCINMPAHNEEAAYGAALFALFGSGICNDLTSAQRLIQYDS